MKTNHLKQYSRLILKPLSIALLAIIFVYAVVNAPALWKKTDYYYKTQVKKEPYGTGSMFSPQIDPSGLTVKEEPQTQNELANNHLYIPSLNIDVPVVWGIAEEDILNQLSNGVVQFGGSRRPDGGGNVFLIGHSSYYWWSKNPYKNVFALLPQMKKGDTVVVTYNNQPYVYQVTETETVSPQDTNVIDSRGKSELTLMTCVPVGTDISRLIVRAELLNPRAQTTTPANSSQKIELLPKVY